MMLGRKGSSSSSSGGPSKSKICLYYQQLFSVDEQGDCELKRKDTFWSEFFLLWSNIPSLEAAIQKLDRKALSQYKSVINELMAIAIDVLREEQENIRSVNALQTMIGVIRSCVGQAKQHTGLDPVDLVFGLPSADRRMKDLIESLSGILMKVDSQTTLKTLSLRLLLTIALGWNSIGENIFLEYLLINSVFEAIVQIIGDEGLRVSHGYDCLLLLTLLANYRKHDNINPYIVKLSILDNELPLNDEMGSSEAEGGGMLSSVTNIMGRLFVPEEPELHITRSDEGLLLALYEAVHLNRNFFTTLTTLSTEGTSNLIVEFLTYTSVLLQDLSKEGCRNGAKLCMVALTCIVEDQYANTLMHDPNMGFRVPLYRARMRHRKGSFDSNPTRRPLASTVLDLCVEFIQSHMMRNFPIDLYMWCLGIIHRILCFQRKSRNRLHYSWRDLWNALGNLLKFVTQNESILIDRVDIFALSYRVTTILNLFITFGDTFLPSPADYDHLYYEIVRQNDVFTNFYSMILRYLTDDNPRKEMASKLVNQLVNIRAIINHFQPKIDQLDNGCITQEQVLDVVRDNYDTLTLKLYENLDVYQRYNEKPQEASFFAQIVQDLIMASRTKLESLQLDQKQVIKEMSTIK